MVQSPISSDLQAAYRSVLSSQTAPTTFDTDTPLTPVVILGTASLNTAASFMKLTDGNDNLDINSDGSLNIVGVPKLDSTKTEVRIVTGKAPASITAGTGSLLYTVTAGKKFRVTSSKFWTTSATNSAVELRDGTTIAGTVKQNGYIYGGGGAGPDCQQYLVPVSYSTGVFVDVQNTCNLGYEIVGYEE